MYFLDKYNLTLFKNKIKLRVQGLGFRVSGFEFRVSGLGFGVWGLERDRS
jgi:hypothetical protein